MANGPQKNSSAQRKAQSGRSRNTKKNSKRGKYAKTPSRSVNTAAIIAVCVAILAIAAGVIAAGFFLTHPKEDNGRIVSNVSIAGVNVGGMTKEEAIAAVETATANTYTRNSMLVRINSETFEITPSVSGAKLDVSGAVNSAYAYGRTGSALQQQQEQDNALRNGYQVNLSSFLTLNMQSIQAKLLEFSENYSSVLTQSSYEFIGQIPPLEESAEASDGMTLVITVGTPEYSLDLDALCQEIVEAYHSNIFQVQVDCPIILPEPLDLAEILAGTRIEPVDAVMDEDTYEVQEAVYGYGIDPETAQILTDAAPYGTRLEIPFERIAPAVLSEDLSGKLFRDVLGTYTATSSSDPDRDQNLALACAAINGTILKPGDRFSYNGALGERTEANGYRPGASYSGSETVYTVGGGICQVSSSLYYCALLADLEIIDRECHAFAPSYMRLGTDATVNWGTLDFVFRNNMDYPIRIEATATGGVVTVTLLGTDERNYYVEIESELIRTHSYTTVYEEYPADNPKGYKDGEQIVSPYTGYDVKTYRCKYNKQTKELISREYEATSNYKKRDAVICRIVGQTEQETQPTEPTTGNVSDNPGVLPPE